MMPIPSISLGHISQHRNATRTDDDCSKRQNHERNKDVLAGVCYQPLCLPGVHCHHDTFSPDLQCNDTERHTDSLEEQRRKIQEEDADVEKEEDVLHNTQRI